MSSSIDIALVGIGGFGGVYVAALLDALPRGRVRLVGVADPFPSSCKRLAELNALGIPVFSSAELLLANVKPDLTVLATPISLHHEQVLAALRAGSHVLVEKPLCATIAHGRDMLEKSRQAQRHVAVGFQWSFGKATHALKQDIRSGVLGKPRRLRTLVLWPRHDGYYQRNSWAGRMMVNGKPVYDSPVSNACSHFLHNMLYVLGEIPEATAMPTRVTAELYRCKRIENYDTAAIRATMASGAELLFITSHATAGAVGPVFEYECELGTVYYSESVAPFDGALPGHFVARFRDGRVKDYGRPPHADDPSKLFQTIESIRENKPSLCGIKSALPHLVTTVAAQQSSAEIVDFPVRLVETSGEGYHAHRHVPSLDEVLLRCYREYCLPSELGLPWAVAGSEVVVEPSGVLREPRGKTTAAVTSHVPSMLPVQPGVALG